MTIHFFRTEDGKDWVYIASHQDGSLGAEAMMSFCRFFPEKYEYIIW